MTAEQLQDLIARDKAPTILDVRTRVEYRRGHVPGAVHIPFERVFNRVVELAYRDGPVIVYCGHGPRAYLAGAILRALGFRIDYLKGHWAGWKRKGLPIHRAG